MTTTEKTVAVPVAALERLVKERTLRYHDYAGALYEVRGDAMADLVALIPAPLKVGDSVTRENWNDLPRKSVIADKDGDLWVRVGNSYAYLNVSDNESITAERAINGPADFYGPFTIVYIQESK